MLLLLTDLQRLVKASHDAKTGQLRDDGQTHVHKVNVSTSTALPVNSHSALQVILQQLSTHSAYTRLLEQALRSCCALITAGLSQSLHAPSCPSVSTVPTWCNCMSAAAVAAACCCRQCIMLPKSCATHCCNTCRLRPSPAAHACRAALLSPALLLSPAVAWPAALVPAPLVPSAVTAASAALQASPATTVAPLLPAP